MNFFRFWRVAEPVTGPEPQRSQLQIHAERVLSLASVFADEADAWNIGYGGMVRLTFGENDPNNKTILYRTSVTIPKDVARQLAREIINTTGGAAVINTGVGGSGGE